MAELAEYECDLDAVGEMKARTELGEVATDRMAAVQALREWVEGQSDWLKSPTGTQFLLGFLRHRKFSQKAAKERLIKYWTARTEMPSWFLRVDTRSELMTERILRGAYLPLPKLDRDGSRVILMRVGLMEPKKDLIAAQMRALGAGFDALLMSDVTHVCGVKVVQDFTGVPAELVLRMAEGPFKHVTRSYLKSYPVRIVSTEYYNVGALFDAVFALVRQFVPKKIQERTQVHKSLRTLYDKVDMSVLPREYLPDDYTGPHAGTIPQIVENYRQLMQQDSTRDYIWQLSSGEYGCDVKKKPEDVIPTESFRSLKI